MLAESIFHCPRDKWAYACSNDTIRLRVRTKRLDIEEVTAVAGDKYDWERCAQEVPLTVAAFDDMFDYWECDVTAPFRRLVYALRFRSGGETLWMTESGFAPEQPHPPGGYFEIPYIHEIEVFQTPQWAKEAVFYQIFPDRFANGDRSNDPEGTEDWGGEPRPDNFFGGDLQGVLDHLDHLVDLGVNAIYFTPLFTSPSNHKYDTVDYMEIDPQFGDAKLLKRLVDACHEQGIRVMLDAVFNHCSEHFPPFRDVMEKGEASKYKDWFRVKEFPLRVENGLPTYETFGFIANMPKFNTANPEVKEYLLHVADYWTREIGVDGWRLDVADEIDHQFWRNFRKTVKDANPEAFIVGEVWSDSLSWLQGDQFDSVMNYPVQNNTIAFFSGADPDAARFAGRYSRLLMRYPHPVDETLFNLLASHDTPRALAQLKEDKRRLKLAAVFLLTSVGTPCIFYGDEVGLTGGPDPGCRKCMEWDPARQDRELYDFYKLIIGLRRRNSALRSGSFRFLKADEGDGTIIYERADERRRFTVWMNNREEPATLSLPAPDGNWRDALSGEPVPAEDGVIRIELPELDYRILVLDTDEA